MLKTVNNFLKIWSKRIIFIIFSTALFLFLVKQSFAKDFISTNEAINQIEKVLSVPKGSIITQKSKINIDRVTKAEDKEAATDANGEEKKPGKVEIKVVEKRDDKSNRIKEKLAYNATISGQYEAAAELYKQVLKSEPSNNYAKFGLASNYHKLKQYKQAKQIYYELLTSDIENKDEVISNFLEILVEESPSDAKYVLARLSAQSPNADYILARSALSYDKIGKKDEAILLLKRAIALSANNLEYQLNLAILLDQNNEPEEALGYYKKVLDGYIRSGVNATQQIDLNSIKQRIGFIESSS